jgi:hypothetical protein
MRIVGSERSENDEKTQKDTLDIRIKSGSISQIPLELTRLPSDTIRLDPQLTMRVLSYLPDARVGEGGKVFSSSNRPLNPALQVLVSKTDSEGKHTEEKRWLFAKFPNFSHKTRIPELMISFHKAAPAKTPATQLVLTVTNAAGEKTEHVLPLSVSQDSNAREGDVVFVAHSQPAIDAYKSHLTVLDSGKPVASAVIQVNHPLKYKDVRFYQSSYRPDENNELTISGLEIVKTPGLLTVYVGFVAILLGVVWTFYLEQLLRRRRKA